MLLINQNLVENRKTNSCCIIEWTKDIAKNYKHFLRPSPRALSRVLQKNVLHWWYRGCYVFNKSSLNPVNLVISKKNHTVDVFCVAPRWEDYKRQAAPIQAYIFYHLRSAFLSRIGMVIFNLRINGLKGKCGTRRKVSDRTYLQSWRWGLRM